MMYIMKLFILWASLLLLFGGCSDPTYTIRDSSGVEKQVTAHDSKDLGERISRGEFDD